MAQTSPRRRSLRLPEYDYAQAGAYFVTICVQGRECVLGEVRDGVMQANDFGKIVQDCWYALPNHYPGVSLDAFVVMPNHVHGVIVLGGVEVGPPVGAGLPLGRTCRPAGRGKVEVGPPVGAGLPRPYRDETAPTPQPTLGQVVGYFKYQTTKMINLLRRQPGTKFWQRNYYEHVIRNEDSLTRIREYILTNPRRWDLDQENPQRQGDDKFDRWLASFHTRPVKRPKKP